MVKTNLHLFVALGLWFGLSYFGLHWGIKAGAIVGGFILVHFICEKYFFDPIVHLGAMHVAEDDPVMLKAIETGKATFPKFLEIYPDHKID